MPIILGKEITPPSQVLSHLYVAQRRVTMAWLAFPLGLLYGCWVAIVLMYLMYMRF
jgi:hypothetical protein